MLRGTKDMKTRIFWCLFCVLSLRADSFAEEQKAEKRTGILGKSVDFHLKISEQFNSIYWLRLKGVKNNIIAEVEKGQPCHIKVPIPKLKSRLNVSSDCRDLYITNLHQEDSGEYKAQIEEHEEKFVLEVYKNLSASDLEVHCENITLGDGNSTLQLNCSARLWEDGVNYTWTPTSKPGNISSRIIQNHFQYGDSNYTCTAENPVSKASKTISIKEACKGPGTMNTTENGKQPSSTLTALWVILAIVIIAAAGIGCVLWKKKKRAAQSMPPDPTVCTVPEEPCKTIYVQIDCCPETQQTEMKKPRPQKRLKAQEGLNTAYASVVPPKPTLLQTDDEKMQMEALGTPEKREKTTYATVTKPQETDDSSIKTVYDTVNAPRHPEGSEFHKLL